MKGIILVKLILLNTHKTTLQLNLTCLGLQQADSHKSCFRTIDCFLSFMTVWSKPRSRYITCWNEAPTPLHTVCLSADRISRNRSIGEYFRQDYFQPGCGSGYFINCFRFHTYRFRFHCFCFQQSLDSISSMNLLTSMTIKTTSLRFTRAHY